VKHSKNVANVLTNENHKQLAAVDGILYVLHSFH